MLASPAYADSTNPASDLVSAGIAADLGTTSIGLGLGAAEMNPFGFFIIPLKFIAKANICTLALASPPAAALCLLGGMMLGYRKAMAVPTTDRR